MVGMGSLLLVFLKLGVVVFGSGYVLLAFLKADLVDRLHWITEAQLLDAITAGQVTPGPLFTTATFLGYLLHGFAGAAAATLAIFLPSFVMAAAVGALAGRIRKSKLASAFLDGVNAAAVAFEVAELHAGDLGAVAKLRETLTGDVLGVKGGDIQVDLAPLPEPAMTYAIEPKSRADEDKLAPAIHKLMEEDLLIRFFRDPMTNEFLLAGAGQPHIETIVSRLKKRYHAEVTLKAPKVPYRETIRAKTEAQGRHKKQTGGHGQFGDCKIRMEPLPRGGGFEFANEVFGGAIPRNFIPAVEKGIVESAVRGYLAGYPVVDFKATVFDGSYHDVDSNEMSFKMAGRIAFRKCMETAKPCLLEPIMKVEIEAPDEFAGTLMGDLNSRRGRVQGMESKGRTTVVNAEVPMAEMLTYGTLLTSMTQGKGSYRMEMHHYDIVPQLVADKILANAKRPVEEEEE